MYMGIWGVIVDSMQFYSRFFPEQIMAFIKYSLIDAMKSIKHLWLALWETMSFVSLRSSMFPEVNKFK